MRISDWSSDVCSSDLLGRRRAGQVDLDALNRRRGEQDEDDQEHEGQVDQRRDVDLVVWLLALDLHRSALPIRPRRSEEHTSELQSLMRISYAVFCLKNKHKNTATTSRTSSPCAHEY